MSYREFHSPIKSLSNFKLLSQMLNNVHDRNMIWLTRRCFSWKSPECKIDKRASMTWRSQEKENWRMTRGFLQNYFSDKATFQAEWLALTQQICTDLGNITRVRFAYIFTRVNNSQIFHYITHKQVSFLSHHAWMSSLATIFLLKWK